MSDFKTILNALIDIGVEAHQAVDAARIAARVAATAAAPPAASPAASQSTLPFAEDVKRSVSINGKAHKVRKALGLSTRSRDEVCSRVADEMTVSECKKVLGQVKSKGEATESAGHEWKLTSLGIDKLKAGEIAEAKAAKKSVRS